MNIHFDVKLPDELSDDKRLDISKQLPEFVAKTLATALRDKAESNARSKISNGGLGRTGQTCPTVM